MTNPTIRVPDAITRKIAAVTINITIDVVVAVINNEEEITEKQHDLNESYWEGYTDALAYIEACISDLKNNEE